jgi:peptidoglycan biosynthesis protein MviN/MurJ (putative lipid II flippase)
MARYTSVYITLATAAASGLGFITQIVLARTFGVGASIDAYLATISIPIFLAATINSAFSYAIVPKIIEARKDSNSRIKYQSNLVMVTLVCVFLCLLGSFLVDIQVRGYQGIQIPELRQLFMLGWCVGAVQIIYGFIYSVLIAQQSFFARCIYICMSLYRYADGTNSVPV